MVTTNEKPLINIQRTKKSNKPWKRARKKKGSGKPTKITQNNTRAINTYLSIIALNVNGLKPSNQKT